MKRNHTRPPLSVTADGKGIASHAGTRLLTEMAEFTGLTSALSEALAPTVRRARRHDPGRVLLDIALTLADGGDCLSDLSVLRDQPAVFGSVASTPTASRVVDSVDAVRLGAIRAARAKAREQAWAAGLCPVSETGPLIMDFDATLVDAHSVKNGAGPTYKSGYGFSPLVCFLDATNEALAALLRPGNRAPHNADDHIEVLDLALAQLPVAPKGLDPTDGVAMLARADSAGASHTFVAPGQSSDAKSPMMGHSSAFSILTAGGTRSSSPTRPTPTSPTSKPVTAAMHALKTASVVPKTPDCATCPSAISPTTPAGSS